MYDLSLREEEITKRVAQDFFDKYETAHILGNIDFCVSVREDLGLTLDSENLQSILWAESKKGNRDDINQSLVQLILTIGKEKTNEKYMPPAFLGAFDAEKIAFIEYHKILHVFSQNDFNWNVTPSNHVTKESNNASFYDIREFFQGKNSSGKMNASSDDEKYNALISDLRAKQKILAKKIAVKVYEYGFLK